MTLSRFLRDYLYVPLGGGREGVAVKYCNIMLVMLLGGLWHGAGWGYVIWGGLHGAYLIVNHAWRSVSAPFANIPGYRIAGWCLTFIVVTFAWVPFRAPDIMTTWAIYQEMMGLSGLNLGYARYLSWGDDAFLGNLGLRIMSSDVTFDSRIWIALALPVVFLAPSLYELTGRFSPASSDKFVSKRSLWSWQPNVFLGVILGMAVCIALLSSAETVEFLYFQF